MARPEKVMMAPQTTATFAGSRSTRLIDMDSSVGTYSQEPQSQQRQARIGGDGVLKQESPQSAQDHHHAGNDQK